MGRPLDWFVVSISLLVLLVNQRMAKDEPGMAARPPEVRALLATAGADTPASPFAYVQPDGTELQVPATGIGPLVAVPVTSRSREDRYARHGIAAAFDSRTAVYTWSVPAWSVPVGSPGRAALPARN
jgi:hypothetical protein